VGAPLGPDSSPLTQVVVDPNIITQDPPEHDRDRRRMMRHFGPPECPHMIAGLEPEIRRRVAELLDNLQGKTRIDVVDEFAFPLPVSVICQILGVPQESIPRFHAWIETALDGLDLGPEAATEEHMRLTEQALPAAGQFGQFLTELLDKYRKQPGPGMLSAMVNDDGPEGRISDASLISNAMLMLFAGHETSVNLIAHSVLSLLRHPDQLEKLRQRPEVIVPGVDELLRLESSVQFWHTRTALEDIEIAGTTIPVGSPIFLAYGSANRDPERFENPEKLDLERPNNEHVGFSQGIHYCFGAPLARLEVQIAVSEFFRRVENPRLVVDPPPYRLNQIFRGPKHLWLDIDGVRD
jgi:cytochrome P450